MKISTDRILTTHVGSLPRPPELFDLLIKEERSEPHDVEALKMRAASAVREVVARQVATGIDSVSDGDMGKISYTFYVRHRLSNIDPSQPPGAEPPREGASSSNPDRIVNRTRNDPVAETNGSRILGWVNLRLTSPSPTWFIPRLSDFSITIGVNYRRAPALGIPLISGIVIHLSVNPTDRIAVTTEPQRVILIFTKLKMVRAVAGIDQDKFFCLRVVVRRLSTTHINWKVISVFVIRTLLAPIWIRASTNRGRHPDTALLVHHWLQQ